jgi:hypothetical protein
MTPGAFVFGTGQFGVNAFGGALPVQGLTVGDIISEAFQKIGVVDETSSPSAEQLKNGLIVLNDMLANEAADGLRIGWYRQSDVTALAPLRESDHFAVKLMLATTLAPLYGIDLMKDNAPLMAQMSEAYRQLVKRCLQYFESDFGELQRPEAGPWGGAGYFL